MTRIHKFATAFILGLVICLALFTTGAFAQRVNHVNHWHGGNAFSNAIAIAGSNDPWNNLGGWGLGSCGFGCWSPFFGNSAFAHAFGGGWDNH